jgi:hypothetical protein
MTGLVAVFHRLSANLKSGGGGTPMELFLEGLADWNTALRRLLDSPSQAN